MNESLSLMFKNILKDKKYMSGKKHVITFIQFKEYLIDNVESFVIVGNSNGHNYPVDQEFKAEALNPSMRSSAANINLKAPTTFAKVGISAFLVDESGITYNSLNLQDVDFKMKEIAETRNEIEDKIVELQEKIEDAKMLLTLMEKYHLDTITDTDKKTILTISKLETFDPSTNDQEKFISMRNILENI